MLVNSCHQIDLLRLDEYFIFYHKFSGYMY